MERRSRFVRKSDGGFELVDLTRKINNRGHEDIIASSIDYTVDLLALQLRLGLNLHGG
jgi:hypothetical protein